MAVLIHSKTSRRLIHLVVIHTLREAMNDSTSVGLSMESTSSMFEWLVQMFVFLRSFKALDVEAVIEDYADDCVIYVRTICCRSCLTLVYSM